MPLCVDGARRSEVSTGSRKGRLVCVVTPSSSPCWGCSCAVALVCLLTGSYLPGTCDWGNFADSMVGPRRKGRGSNRAALADVRAPPEVEAAAGCISNRPEHYRAIRKLLRKGVTPLA